MGDLPNVTLTFTSPLLSDAVDDAVEAEVDGLLREDRELGVRRRALDVHGEIELQLLRARAGGRVDRTRECPAASPLPLAAACVPVTCRTKNPHDLLEPPQAAAVNATATSASATGERRINLPPHAGCAIRAWYMHSIIGMRRGDLKHPIPMLTLHYRCAHSRLSSEQSHGESSRCGNPPRQRPPDSEGDNAGIRNARQHWQGQLRGGAQAHRRGQEGDRGLPARRTGDRSLDRDRADRVLPRGSLASGRRRRAIAPAQEDRVPSGRGRRERGQARSAARTAPEGCGGARGIGRGHRAPAERCRRGARRAHLAPRERARRVARKDRERLAAIERALGR